MATRPDRWLGFTLREHAAALVVFAAVAVVVFQPLFRGETFSDITPRQRDTYPWRAVTPEIGSPLLVHWDQADAFYPWQVFMNRQLRSGDLPYWDPHGFAGHPFFANGASGVLYPPKVALATTASPARVHDVLAFSHLVLAGLAMFLFLGAVGLSFASALVGGLAWALNSFTLAWQALDHYHAIEVWLPVGFLLVFLTVTRGSWAAALGLAGTLALMFVGGHVLLVELSLAVLAAFAVTLVVRAARRDRSSVAENVLRLGAAGALFLGLTAIVSLPTLALAGTISRAGLSYGELESHQLPFSALRNLVYPADIDAGRAYNRDLFAGTAVALLAALGLLRVHVTSLFAGALGALTVLYMLHTPVTWVVSEVLPGFDSFKPLARAAFLLQFALAVLAAFGFERVRDRLRQRPLRIASALAVGLVASAVAVSIVVQAHRLTDDVMRHQPNEPKYLYPPTPLTDFLAERGGRFLPTKGSFRGSTAMVFPLDSAGGYDSLVPARIQDFWRVVGDGEPVRSLDQDPLIYAYYTEFPVSKLRPGVLARAGVSWVVTPPDIRAPGFELRYDGADGRAFAVPGALPRAYVAGGCVEVADGRAALERFVAGDVESAGAVVLETGDPMPESHSCDGRSGPGAGSATVVDETVDSLVVRVRAQGEAWLVVTDSFDEGWRATVDGEGVDVLPANSAQRAVAVTRGEHLVRFTYEPVHFRYGAALSGLSLAVLAGGLGWLALRRRTSRDRPS